MTNNTDETKAHRLTLSNKLNILHFNHELFKELFLNNINYEEISGKFRYIETNADITKTDIKSLEKKIELEPTYQSLSIKEKIILAKLIEEGNETAYFVRQNTD